MSTEVMEKNEVVTGEVLNNLVIAPIYARDKKFTDEELREKADDLKKVNELQNTSTIMMCYRLLAIKEHARNSKQFGLLLGREKADFYEFVQATIGRGKTTASKYVKVADTFRKCTTDDGFITDKTAYYLDPRVAHLSFESLYAIASCSDFTLPKERWEFAIGLDKSISSLEVVEELKKLAKKDDGGENTDGGETTDGGENTDGGETADGGETTDNENVSRETLTVDYADLTAKLRSELGKWLRANAENYVEDLSKVGIVEIINVVE